MVLLFDYNTGCRIGYRYLQMAILDSTRKSRKAVGGCLFVNKEEVARATSPTVHQFGDGGQALGE